MATGASAPPLTPEELERKNAERQQAAGISLTVSNVFRQLEQSWRVGDTAQYDALSAMLPGLRTEGQALDMFTGRSRGRGRGQGGNPNPNPGGSRP